MNQSVAIPEYTMQQAERQARKKNKAAAEKNPLFAAMGALEEVAPLTTPEQAQARMQAYLEQQALRHTQQDILSALRCRALELELAALVGEAQMQTWRTYFLRTYPAGWMRAGHSLANLWHGRLKQVQAGTFVPDAQREAIDPFDEVQEGRCLSLYQAKAWSYLYVFEPAQPDPSAMFLYLLNLRGDDLDRIRQDLAAMERHGLACLKVRDAQAAPQLREIGGLFREETLLTPTPARVRPLDYALPRALAALRAFAAESGLFDTCERKAA